MSVLSKKESILQAATLLFSEKGFRHTSIEEIANMTGVAEGTVFYHFKSKDGLFLAILNNLKKDVVEQVTEFYSEREFGDGLQMVEAAISFYIHLEGVLKHRFFLLHRHYAYEFAMTNAECHKYLEIIYEQFIEMFEKGILLGHEDGSIRRDVSARKTALIIFSMVDGLVRLNTYGLYSADPLFEEVVRACRRMLENEKT
ncbi:MAG: TetR/AcrR family transcriptional regulator [Deltaproteobacteria bacterium]|nr:TetR/AcrR family transcriptional regulator [Deltaproteobacteria bacterium]